MVEIVKMLCFTERLSFVACNGFLFLVFEIHHRTEETLGSQLEVVEPIEGCRHPCRHVERLGSSTTLRCAHVHCRKAVRRVGARTLVLDQMQNPGQSRRSMQQQRKMMSLA
eukprot:6093226-Amphidinium_carterae.1